MRTMALLAMFSCCSVPAAAQPVVGFTRTDVPAATTPRAVVAADFDRDGFPDFAQTGLGGSVGIWLNRMRTDEGFVRFRVLTVGGGPFDMAAGDLNRDGWPDLVIANADLEGVTILLSTGQAGGFTKRDYLMPGANPRGVALGDRNRDGALDIFVTEYATGAWRVLYGDGSGGVLRADRFGAIRHAQGVVAADFNRDGWLDVAIAGSGINLVAVFYSTATGELMQRNVSVGGHVNVLTSGDFNRDGWLDLAAASSSNNAIYTLHGSASGLAWRVSTATGASPRGIVAADVNQDGWPDLITANRASSTTAIHFGMPTRPGSFTEPRVEPAGRGSRAVAAADFDRDGLTDLATANEYNGSATLLRNNTALVRPGLVFRFQAIPEVEGSFGSNMFAADLNHNDRPDLIQEGGGIVLDGVTPFLLPGPAFSPAVGDLNRDGHQDIVAIDKFEERTLRVSFGDGRGAFPSTATVGSWDADTEARNLAVADTNRDGSADLLVTLINWRTRNAAMHVFAGRGDGTFDAATVTPLAAGTNAMAVADMDRDGRFDVLLSFVRDGEHNLTLQVLFGDGRGAFSRTIEHSVPANIVDIAVADANHDGQLDVIGVTFEVLLVMVGKAQGGLADAIAYR